VIAIAAIFNAQLEKKKTEIEQVNLAQSMLTTIFSNDAYRAFATQRLLEKVLEDTTLNSEIGDIIVTYYEKKIEEYINLGKIDDAQTIVDAAKYVGGRLAKKFEERIEQDQERQNTLTKFQKASRSERSGFNFLLAGKYDEAITAFQQADEIYPTFHQVYEISCLLIEERNNLSNPAKRKEVYRRIITDYSWGAPKDLLDELRRRANL
ncbi:MAG: hypothetical protein JSW07_02410, partial [bacterium]